MPKPPKKPYPNQEEVKEKILKFIFDNINAEEIYICGSVLRGDFGVYETTWVNEGGFEQTGSDIDLVLLMKEIPETWTKTNIERHGLFIYRIADFEYDGNKHPIEASIVNNFQELEELKSKFTEHLEKIN